jgi:hypothetical protein
MIGAKAIMLHMIRIGKVTVDFHAVFRAQATRPADAPAV